MKKIFNRLSTMLIVLHFAFISCIQVYDLGYFKSDALRQLKEHYVLPFFEQNWSMFSPNPPHGNHFFLLKFSTSKAESDYIDINQKIRERSFSLFFSIDQRIKKYFSGCFNDIINIQETGVNLTDNPHKSQGLESILNYSKFTFEHLADFKAQIQPNDSVFVHIYLVNEQLNNEINQEKSYISTYNELDKIYLLKNN